MLDHLLKTIAEIDRRPTKFPKTNANNLMEVNDKQPKKLNS